MVWSGEEKGGDVEPGEPLGRGGRAAKVSPEMREPGWSKILCDREERDDLRYIWEVEWMGFYPSET